MYRVVDLRERGKQRRRQRVLDAARRSVVRDGVEALRMRALAEQAELSSRTLYNLFGSKAEVLAALTFEALDALAQELGPLSGGDPIARSRSVITLSIERFHAKRQLYRPLLAAAYRGLGGPSGAAVLGEARRLQREALEEAQQRRQLRTNVAPDLVAHHVLGAYNHAAAAWSRGELDHEEFRTQAVHAWACLLLGVATPSTRERLLRELEELSPAMEAVIAASAAVERPERRIA